MRKSEARKVVAAYVADRLARECPPGKRGAQAAVAKSTGFSRGHVNNVIKGQAGVGEDFAEKIAEHWHMTYDELQSLAEVWAEENGIFPPSAKPVGRRLRDRPEWEGAFEKARAFYEHISVEYMERVGLIYDDVTHHIDAQFIGEMARVIMDNERREHESPPRSVVGATAKGHTRDKKAAKH